jgi:ADP-heptose:LPS heptosyltransferase
MDLLIVKVSSFGDIVHGLQVVASLRAQLPEKSRVTWLAMDRFAGLVESSGVADECWMFSRKKGILGGRELREKLRNGRFDAALDLQGRLKTAYWAWCAQARRRIGRGDARELAGIFYPETAALPPGGRYGSHAIEILLKYLPLFGCEEKLAGPLGFPRSPRPAAVDPAVLAARPILIFPDSARAEKEWPGHRELTRRLANENPKVPVAWPGWADMAPPDGIEHGNFHNLMKKVPLKELPSLVASARLVVANDSGPMHLAAAMGVPVIGIFGPSSARRYRPWALTPGQARVIEAPGARLANLTVETVHAEITACLRARGEVRLGI